MCSKERHEDAKSVPGFNQFFIPFFCSILKLHHRVAIKARNIASDETDTSHAFLQQNRHTLFVILPIWRAISRPDRTKSLSSRIKASRKNKWPFSTWPTLKCFKCSLVAVKPIETMKTSMFYLLKTLIYRLDTMNVWLWHCFISFLEASGLIHIDPDSDFIVVPQVVFKSSAK